MGKSATPFTVIGGFLGAGKTTLLNHILQHNRGVRYAVLVNDFGAINIDASLLVQHNGQTLTLSNGCICCSLADGFINTMLRLMQRRDDFDHIVVEASGVSEPQRIMDFARIDPELSADAIILMVDAANHSMHASDQAIEAIIAAQTKSADLILINKTDLVSAQSLAQLECDLTTDNPSAKILYCQQAQLPLAVLLGTEPIHNALTEAATSQAHSDIIFCSASLYNPTPIDKTQFMQFCQDLNTSVLRGKGLLRFNDNTSTGWIWHKVSQQEQLAVAQVDTPDSECQLILIAKQTPLHMPDNAHQLFEKIELSVF